MKRDKLYTLAIALLFGVFLYFFINTFVYAAFKTSDLFTITKEQIDYAVEVGAIKPLQLEVVNNYGSQLETWNPQQ